MKNKTGATKNKWHTCRVSFVYKQTHVFPRDLISDARKRVIRREGHLGFNMAVQASNTKFNEIYELKEELGK